MIRGESNASVIVERAIEAGHASKDAYVSEDETLTFEGLRRKVNQMGHLLRDLGVRREERVLLVLDNTTAFPIAFMGAVRIGAVPTPVSVLEAAENFRHFIEDSYAKVVICDGEVLERLKAALSGYELHYIARGGGEGAVDMESALAAQEGELDPAATHPDDMAFWLYSSGSTGKPKGVVHLHKSIQVTCEGYARQVLEISESDRIFSTTKLYHAYGLGNLLSFPLYFGATGILVKGAPTPELLLRTLRQFKPTLYFSVPALYAQLAGDPDSDGALDSVRVCVSAAEALPLRTFERWRERFGLELVDTIGSTEMLHTYCGNRPGAVVPGTMGVPAPGCELRLVDEAGVELQGPAVGAMEVRGASCAAYYWHQHERTKRAMRGEWFATGDSCERRADGSYVYVGRVDDMVKVGGLWVSPIDMEQVLLEHPAVVGVGVVGTRVDGYSRVAAFVRCAEGVSPDEELSDSLRSLCRERMREHEYPHLIRYVSDLPQTLTGKPRRFKLREMIEQELSAGSEQGALPANEIDAQDAQLGPAAAVRTAADTVSTAPASAPAPSRQAFTQDLVGLSHSEREQAVKDLVVENMAEVIGRSAAEMVGADRTFKELGVDSLAAVELRNRLATASGLRLPSTLTFDHPTPEGVIELLCRALEGAGDVAEGEDGGASGGGEQASELEPALEKIGRLSLPPPMPPTSLSLRLKTSPGLRRWLPAAMLVDRAARRGEALWASSAEERKQATAAMETVLGPSSDSQALAEIARVHVIERSVDRELFWQPWSAKIDSEAEGRLRAALSQDRGVILSSCHLGPYYRLGHAAPFAERQTYLVPGPWFFTAPSNDEWGRRLARWRQGMKSLVIPADGSFPVIHGLLERHDPVFIFFDMPGPCETRFLGKPATLAEGTAQLAVGADALVVPVRARRLGPEVWVDVGTPLDPRELAGVDDLQKALAAQHEQWILENPAAMEDPRSIGWGDGATPQAWTQGQPA